MRMKIKKERIPYIDIARALSIAVLVLGHTLGYSEHSKVVYKLIYSFVVPLFFFISGYVMDVQKKAIPFIKQRFFRIMVPYFLWSLVFIGIYMIIGGDSADALHVSKQNSALVLLRNTLYGIGKDGALQHNSSLWFLPALFTMEVMYYFVISITNRLHDIRFDLLMGIGLFVIGIISSKHLTVDLPWGINTALVAGPYFYVGHLLRKHDMVGKLCENHFSVFMMAGLVGVWICAALSNKLLAFMSYSYGNMWWGYLSGISMSVIALVIARCIQHAKILEYVGRSTLSIMLFHKLPVIVFQTKAEVVSGLLKNSNVYCEVTVALVVTAIAICFSLVADKVLQRVAPFTIGKNSRKQV